MELENADSSGQPAQPGRRSLMAGAIAGGFAPRMFLGAGVGVGGLLWSTSAAAEPLTICLAVASVVLGAIQAHNSSDGGTAGMLKASLEYQRVMSNQLGALMTSVAEMKAQLGALAEAQRRTPQLTVLFELQAALGGASRQYQKLVAASDGSPDFQTWRARSQRQLGAIADKISEKLAVAEYESWVGPATATVMVSATETLMAVQSVLAGSTNRESLAFLRQYLVAYQMVEDPNIPSSTAALLNGLNGYRADYEASVGTLAGLRFVVNRQYVDALPPVAVVLGGASIQDYTEEKVNSVTYAMTGKGDRMRETGRVISRDVTPARVGTLEHFSHSATVTPYFEPIPVRDGKPVQLRQYGVEDAIATNSVGAAVPGTAVERFNAPAAQTRRELAVQDPRIQPSRAHKAKLSEELGKLNLAAANILTCELALLNVRRSRQWLLAQYERSA